MMLIVSTCRYVLSEEEFVRPVVEIVRECGFDYQIRRYHERFETERYSGIIICGTALRDFDYLRYVENFRCLTDYDGKILGICAGYQILARLYSNTLERIKKIGVYDIETVRRNPLIEEGSSRAYFLHAYALRDVNENLEPIAMQNDEVCMFKVRGKDFYGTSSHPEVLNGEIIVNYLCKI